MIPLWVAGALAFVSTTVGFSLLGAFFDRWQGTSPRGLVVGVVAGWGIGIYELYKIFELERRRSRPKRDKDRPEGGKG
jgi:F0F1-type ATP synthase assembly protein I